MNAGRACLVGIAVLLLASAAVGDEPTVRVEHSKPSPAPAIGLGTQFYRPTEVEKERTKGWKREELESGKPDVTTLHGAAGRRVAWFGIVREVREDTAAGATRLLVEMKYFDGLTDTHQQIVSLYGAGDFRADVTGVGHKIERLDLVRVYGTVMKEKDGVPEVAAEYVRCWGWGGFAFMDYGEDKSNPEWVKLRRAKEEEDVYASRPDRAYYEGLLGKR
jgi:hypothetical protein